MNAKIREECAENKGSTIGSERRVKLVNCVEKKNRATMSIAWEEKYAEFVSYDGMPKNETPLFTWLKTQLGNGHASLNAKIQKELAENKGSTIWSERRVKLVYCVEKKNRTKMSIAWEEKYAEFVSYDGMPMNELSNGHGSLNVKIRKEKTENIGSTIWSERRVKLANCVEQKRRE